MSDTRHDIVAAIVDRVYDLLQAFADSDYVPTTSLEYVLKIAYDAAEGAAIDFTDFTERVALLDADGSSTGASLASTASPSLSSARPSSTTRDPGGSVVASRKARPPSSPFTATVVACACAPVITKRLAFEPRISAAASGIAVAASGCPTSTRTSDDVPTG